MAQRNIRGLDRRSIVDGSTPPCDEPGPWLFPFDRTRHERSRALLGPDAAVRLTRPPTAADAVDEMSRGYERLCEADDGRALALTPPAVTALGRLADVEERYVMLLGGESGHDTLTLSELAVAHRRQLVRVAPSAQRPLLALSLVLLTHQLHAAGRFADAIATGQESIDILSRQLEVGDDVDVRPALVLALDASLMTCLAKGRRVDALEDLVRAADLLDRVCRDHAEYTDDRDDHLRVLSHALSSVAVREEVPPAVFELAARLGVPPPEPTAVGGSTARTAGRARSQADDLHDDALHLAVSDGDGPAAAAAAGSAVNAYRQMLTAQPAHERNRLLRRLSRALWRHATILNELLGRSRDAMGPGRESLALARQLLRSTECADELDELIGELGVTLHDLSHIALAAGLIGEHDQLAEEAARISCWTVGARALRALGAALHRRAADACETTVALALRGRSMSETVAAGVHTSARAVAIRRTLIDDDDSTTRWELANSLLAHGHLRCLDGEGQQGAQAMADAHRTVSGLPGREAQSMRDAARTALLAACAAHDDVVPVDDWPL